MKFTAKKICALVALLLPGWAMAQYYNGVGIEIPQATFHIHSTQEYEHLLPWNPNLPNFPNANSTASIVLPPSTNY